MVTANTPQPSGLFGAYQQVGDLDRTLSFYRDVLAAEVVWSDGALAVLHGHRAHADSLVIREIGRAARHTKGEAGVTRVPWRAGDPAGLDSTEALLTRRLLPYRRRRDTEVDGITMHDPDGLEIVLLWIGEKVPATIVIRLRACATYRINLPALPPPGGWRKRRSTRRCASWMRTRDGHCNHRPLSNIVDQIQVRPVREEHCHDNCQPSRP